MPQFLVAIQHPDNYQLPEGPEGEAMIREISALNREMIAAGVRDFAGGLQAAGKAKSLRKQDDGEVLITDGPYLEAKEHTGGVWLLKCADMEEALEWARRAVVACRVPVEVREFLEIPPKWKADGGGSQ
ncbi:MAG: YciI family protein [Acidobacteriota bacterium]